jgi:hypothetical protein
MPDAGHVLRRHLLREIDLFLHMLHIQFMKSYYMQS